MSSPPKNVENSFGFHVSLIEPFVKGNRDVDFNAVLKPSNPIENAPDYDVNKVMGSTEIDVKVLYLVEGLASKETVDQRTLR
jgi:hypothetical protein